MRTVRAAASLDCMSDSRRLLAAVIFGATTLLVLAVLAGSGAGHSWGAAQWGPVSAWLASGLTLAAVVVALRGASLARQEAARNQRARLIDHEISRRREKIDALGELWAAINGIQTEVQIYISWVEHKPLNAAFQTQTKEEGKTLFRQLVANWSRAVDPRIFIALVLLNDETPLGTAVRDFKRKLVDFTASCSQLDDAVIAAHRASADTITATRAAWNSVIASQDTHLDLAHEHLSLRFHDVEHAVDLLGR